MRAKFRQANLINYYNLADYADVVRDAQEVVELCLKAILMFKGIHFAKSHDVGGEIMNNKDCFTELNNEELERIKIISRQLRKDRELAFYGADDILPLQYYAQEDGDTAIMNTQFIMEIVDRIVM